MNKHKPGLSFVNISLVLVILISLFGFVNQVTATPIKPGDTWAWGMDQFGQLGDGGTSNRNVPYQLTAPSSVIGLSGGYYHTLALKNDGTVYAWGRNNDGELGNGITDTNLHANPEQIYDLTQISAISAGAWHNLALKSDGSVWAWGWNDNGQLGDNTTIMRTSPVLILPAGSGVVAISAGYGHSLALKSDGTVLAWGYNAEGQLGDNTTSNHEIPMPVPGLTGVTGISAGWFHSLALKSDGTVWAWGMGIYGQLGIGSQANSAIPVQITGLSGITTIASGDYHSLAIKNDKTLWTWGNNNQGQLGDGTAGDGSVSNIRTTPYNVTGFTPGVGVVSMAGGWGHTLALLDDGTAWSWGLNDAGQLGLGSLAQALAASPQSVQSEPQSPHVPDGIAEYTWGQNQANSAMKAMATAPIYKATPSRITAITKVAIVAAGYYQSLAMIPNPKPAWDVNGDHVIDIGDIALVGFHWLETGTPGWIPEDVNTDGIVDIADVALIGLHWLETW